MQNNPDFPQQLALRHSAEALLKKILASPGLFERLTVTSGLLDAAERLHSEPRLMELITRLGDDPKLLKLNADLQAHPELRARVEAILEIADNTSDQFRTADEAEAGLIVEMRKLGHEVLTEWSQQTHDKVLKEAKQADPTAHNHKKKSSHGTPYTE